MMQIFQMERTLRNGATVIAFMGDVVLAEWDKGTHKEYVTWRVDANADAYCGHYFRDLDEAKADFKERI
jgi:hypothetical protein